MTKSLITLLTMMPFTAIASNNVNPAIVNGSVASSTNYPSIATLFIDTLEYDGRYSTGNYCGASIIDANHVLTAAHCVYNNTLASLLTTVVPQLDNEEDFPSKVQPFGAKQRVRVSAIYYPDNYSDSNQDLLPNDIALLKLETPHVFFKCFPIYTINNDGFY